MVKILTLMVIVLVFIYAVVIMSRTRDFFNPIMTFITPIAAGYIVFLLYYAAECSDYTVWMYLVGIVSFAAGFIFHRIIVPYKLKYSKLGAEGIVLVRISKQKQWIIQTTCILAIILTVRYIINVAFNGPFGENVLRNIRYMSNYVVGKGFATEYSMAVAKTFFLILLYQHLVQRTLSSRKWIIISFIAVIIGITSTIARTQVLTTAASVYYFISLKRNTGSGSNRVRFLTWKKLRENWLLFFGIVTVAYIFYYFALRTMKLGSEEISDADFFLNRYLGRPLLIFENNVKGSSYSGYGYYSSGWISKIFTALGFMESPGILEEQIARTDGAVASFIRAPYIDFGGIGIFIIMFVTGFCNSYIYRRVLRKLGYWSIFYTTCIYSNLMAFFDYQYMTSGQMYVLFVLVIASSAKMRAISASTS